MRRDIVQSYRLTPVQEGILFHNLLTARPEEHCEQIVVDIAGTLDSGAFHRAWRRVIERHAVLRTSFVWEGSDEPIQLVHRNVPFDIRRLDWRNDGAGVGSERLESFLAEDRLRVFPLSRPPLMRMTLIATGERRHTFVWSIHAAILDDRSVSIVLEEVFSLYGTFLRSEEPDLASPPSFAEYVSFIRDFKEIEARRYWCEKLSGYTPGECAIVPVHRSIDSGEEYYRDAELKLSGELSRGVNAIARRYGLSVETVVTGAWAVLLGRYADENDVVFGNVLSGRSVPLPGIESMVGVCIHTVPVRTLIDRRERACNWLSRFHEERRLLLRHGLIPLVSIHEYAGTPASRRMFDTITAFGSLQVLETPRGGFDGIEIVSARRVQRTQYPLTLIVYEAPHLLLDCAYDRRRFRGNTIERMLGHMENILGGMIREPEAPLSNIRILPDTERYELVDGLNRRRMDPGPPTLLHRLFEKQSERTPDRIAVCADSQITYAALDRRANRLAHNLRRLGVAPETLIGVCLDRSVELMVAILGVLKAGAAYVPLSPELPHERLSFIVDDSTVSLVLSVRGCAEALAGLGVTVVHLDDDRSPFDGERSSRPNIAVSPENLAYMMYTSGSTGTPKGAMNTHGGISNRVRWMVQEYPLGGVDHLLQKTPFDFDVSVWEMFWPLATGARLVMAEPGKHGDSFYLDRAIARHEITALHFVPSMLQVFLEEGRGDECRTVRDVFCSGEALTVDLKDRFFSTFDAGLHNLYGPVEASVEVTFWQCAGDGRRGAVPIGRPLPNVRMYVLNGALEPTPAGVRGELFIGGVAVARGYLKRPGLTAERFVPDPFGAVSGARMYRSGDIASIGEDGVIGFHGRIDDQVKIRGFRVEPAEIEAVLRRHQAVGDVAVAAREESPGDVRLVCYFTPRRGGSPAVSDLRRFTAERLPINMVPSFFVALDQFPLLPSGKVNRRELPPPDRSRSVSERVYVPPRTAAEKALADIWRHILGIEQVGVHDDFFALGGHSILATRVVSQLRRVCDVDLPLRVMFERPTIAGLAEAVDDAADRRGSEMHANERVRTALEKVPTPHTGDGTGPVRSEEGTRLSTAKRLLLERRLRGDGRNERGAVTIPKRESNGPAPLSFAQQRLWFLDRFKPNSALYNLPATYRVSGPVDVPALTRGLNTILERHDSLRTTFPAVDGEPRQVVDPAMRIELSPVTIDDPDPAKREDRALELATEEVRRPFDLATGPLLRALLVELERDDHLFVVNMHHIVSDAWSLGVFMRELAELYEAYATGRDPALPALSIQYTDFAAWQREHLAGGVLESQLRYWRETLAGYPGVLALPPDHPRPPVQTFSGAVESVGIAPDVAASIRELGRREKTTTFMVLYAAFVTLLYRYTGQEDIAVGTPIAGRNRVELEQLIGFFINTLVLRSVLSGEMTFRELLREVRETVLGAFAHQDVPFERLVEELAPERDTSRSPLFQVVFAMNSVPAGRPRLGDLRLRPVSILSGTSKFDLILTVSEEGGGFSCYFSYSTDLFDRETVARFAQHYASVLRCIAGDPAVRLATLEFISERERARMLVEWNDTHADFPRDRCMHRLFEEQAARRPDAVATVHDGEHITYGVLDRRADALAHRLRSAGVGPEVPVGVCLERRPWVCLTLIGILKAGGVYLPLDPDYPAERLAFMIEDAQASVIVVSEGTVDRLPSCETELLVIDRDGETVAAAGVEHASVPAAPESAAYCIYTSGSTGRPKGVVVRHGGLTNLIWWHRRVYGLREGDRTTQMSSLSFDLSLWEICPALASGATIYIPDEETRLSLRRQIAWLRDCMIDIGILPTPIAEAIMAEEWPDEIAMRALLTGGDRLHGAPRSSIPFGLYNNYGPTESTVIATWTPVPPGGDERAPAVGRPVDNTRVYVLDRFCQPVPIGVSGELYIGGEALARGYLARQALTAERFLPDPFAPDSGERMYRTGDLVRFRRNGDIEFLGRIDDQVKIRGYRIELGEIEAALRTHPAVREAVVSMHEDARREKRLIGYVVPRDGRTPPENDFKTFLKDRLPGYMVPSAMVVLDALPLTPNGKIDRRMLPIPARRGGGDGGARQAPRDEAERIIVDVWRDVLELDRIGIHDNFFDIGGHSMLLVHAHTRLQKEFEKEISIIDMFQYPTVASLAEYVKRERAARPSFAGSEKRGQVRRASLRRRKMRRARRHTAGTGTRSGG